MRYLVDSDYLIDAVGGVPSAVRTLDRLSDQGLAISIVAVGEIYEGAFGFPDPEAMLAAFREFLDDYVVLPLTDPIVERFARVRADLRRRGQLIPDLDLLIGATALQHDLALLTRNVRHYGRIPGLTFSRSN